MKTISPAELYRLRSEKNLPFMLDVRTPVEHAHSHVPGVFLMPLDRLVAAELEKVEGCFKDQPVYIFCQSGGRATAAAEKLTRAGFQECMVVKGGTLAWMAAGLPVKKGAKGALPLERQIHIAIGIFVLSGVLLSQFVNPVFIWVSGFMGAGLIYAGLTGKCGMGVLLSKMPWNQRGAA